MTLYIKITFLLEIADISLRFITSKTFQVIKLELFSVGNT